MIDENQNPPWSMHISQERLHTRCVLKYSPQYTCLSSIASTMGVFLLSTPLYLCLCSVWEREKQKQVFTNLLWCCMRSFPHGGSIFSGEEQLVEWRRDGKLWFCLMHIVNLVQFSTGISLFVLFCLFPVFLEAMFLFKPLKVLRAKRKGTVTFCCFNCVWELLGCLPSSVLQIMQGVCVCSACSVCSVVTSEVLHGFCVFVTRKVIRFSLSNVY